MTRISEAALAELKARNPCDQVVGQWVTLRRHGRKLIGPCPICSVDPASRTATRFECDAEGFVCAVCCQGGDVIRLVERVLGKDFRSAIDWLGGTKEIDPAEAARLQRDRERKSAARERQANQYRERERRALWDIWKRAAPIEGTPVADYLLRRGILRELPARAPLRFVEAMPYYDGSNPPKMIHRGPAMVAAIVRDGKFSGLHFTYLEPGSPDGKALIADPETGKPLPAKKVRGSKAGGSIDLIRADEPLHLIAGEGIETVLSVWHALASLGRDLTSTAFWSSADLGNLGGRASNAVPHPTLRNARGAPQRVPGPEPDFGFPGIWIPDSVTDLVLLGDGDSDRFLTECTLARAAARFAKPGRTVRAAWAPDGSDFNDLIRGAFPKREAA
jgi:CHC2 zinc finger